jgi:large conductance mechanosensitive channel
MIQEFKKFALRGNALDMAVGIIIGAAFGAIVNSIVKDIIMPFIGLLFGGVNFENMLWVLRQGDPIGPYNTLEAAAVAGAVTINYGNFINFVITFIIVALVLFFLIKGMNRLTDLQKKEETPAEPTTKECPFCAKEIPLKSQRCPYCTSTL